MSYETTVKKWAAEHFNIPESDIDRVEFSYDEGDGCPTCGYEGYPYCDIILTTGRVRKESLEYEFADFIRALVAVARRNDEP